MSNTNNSGGGISFTTALTLLFIGLKLASAITWSWWWVLSPIWISICIALFGALIVVIFSD